MKSKFLINVHARKWQPFAGPWFMWHLSRNIDPFFHARLQHFVQENPWKQWQSGTEQV
jgi:hypothetical protein